MKSIEVVHGDKREYTRWRTGEPVLSVVSDEIYELLVALILKLHHPICVVSEPDFLYVNDTVRLKGVKIASKLLGNGVQLISLDFLRFIGSVSDIGSGNDQTARQIDDVVDRVILDLVNPIMDLAGIRALGVPTTPAQAQQFLDMLLERSDEVAFYATLIRRRVSHQAQQPKVFSGTQFGSFGN